MECIDRGWLRELEQKEKEVEVRKQGESCLYSKYLKMFKYMNRRVGWARCSTQILTLSVSRDMFPLRWVDGYHSSLYLQLPGLFRSNYNELSQRAFAEHLVFTSLDDLAQNHRFYISTASFDKTSIGLNIMRMLALPWDDHIRRLKRPEESFERVLDRFDLWKMDAVSDIQLRCENPRLFNASAKWLLHSS